MKNINRVVLYVILIGTLLVSVPRYAAAFAQAEPQFLGLTIAPITGLGFGLLLELGVYYIIDAWLDARRRGLKSHWLLLWGFAIQLVIGPIIIAPAIVGHMVSSPGELAQVLSWRPALWFWATIVALAPILLLAAATAAGYMLEPVSKQKAQEPIVPARARALPSRAVHLCQQCEREFSTVQALNAHRRFCAGMANGIAGSNGKSIAEMLNREEIE